MKSVIAATVTPGVATVLWHDAIRDALDSALAVLEEAGPEHFILRLNDVVARLRDASGDAFSRHVVPEIRRHPATAIARECPITQHTLAWPRGYPGDAGLLDLLYRHGQHSDGVPDAVSGIRASRILATIQNAVPSRAVRHRRMLLADAIDNAAILHPGAEILAVACGHLREVEWSAALAEGRIARFVAADQDRQSLDRVRADYDARFHAVQPTALSVRGILGGRACELGHFHLIYAAGLYNYLPAALAIALTGRLFSLLYPGGRLLIGNFSDGMRESAYMESVMDWPLQWRSEADMTALAAAIPTAAIRTQAIWPDALRACLFLDITRA